ADLWVESPASAHERTEIPGGAGRRSARICTDESCLACSRCGDPLCAHLERRVDRVRRYVANLDRELAHPFVFVELDLPGNDLNLIGDHLLAQSCNVGLRSGIGLDPRDEALLPPASPIGPHRVEDAGAVGRKSGVVSRPDVAIAIEGEPDLRAPDRAPLR